MPAPTYPTASASRSAEVLSSEVWATLNSGEDDSSMTFWLRRWIEQSRTPIAQAVPWASAMSCTSTCRAPVTSRSRKTVPLPKALSASSLVRW